MTTPSASAIDRLALTQEQFLPSGETSPDKNGLVRPTFRIEGEQVAFYSQDDEMLMHDDSERTETPVVASPLGLTEAAIHLCNLPEDSRAYKLHESLVTEDYNEDVLRFLDEINAAVSYDEQDGRLKSEVDEGGFAFVLAALEGDESAQAVIDARLAKLREAYAAAQSEGIEPADPERRKAAEELLQNLALVRASNHAVVRDEHGILKLSPTGDYRRKNTAIPDRYPRATIHFTLNGEVTEQPLIGSWGEAKTLIVANLAKTAADNRLPSTLNTVDTSFDLNPGENLELKGAVLIVDADDIEGVYEHQGDDIRYKRSEHYTDEERLSFGELVGKAPHVVEALSDADIAKKLRSFALEQALLQVGVTTGAIGIEGSSSADGKFDRAVREAGRALGLDTDLHEHQANGRAEQRINQEKEYLRGDIARKYTHTLPASVSISAQRMYVANGYLAPGSHLPEAELQAIREEDGDGL
ncbi:MAG TPA: hypothetical protein QF549_02415 [Candidatus Saccharimonadaceae bacterium]|nr:hypothetical protein [Candidatus Saccharimonadaceae bacterium]